MQIAFLRQVIQTEHGYEWPRPGSITDPYGRISWTENKTLKQNRAHRVAWLLEKGPIPEGYEIDHEPECPKTCVTVEHLQILSKAEHTKLGWERGELNGGWGTKRTRKYEPGFQSNHKGGVKPIPEAFAWKYERLCSWCETQFIPNSPKQIYCSQLCNSRIKESRRAGIRYPKSPPKHCVWCNQIFQPKRSDSNHCSNKCIFDHSNDMRKRDKIDLICKECEKGFQSRPDTIFCSQKCGSAYRDRNRVVLTEKIILKDGETEKSNGWIPPKKFT